MPLLQSYKVLLIYRQRSQTENFITTGGAKATPPEGSLRRPLQRHTWPPHHLLSKVHSHSLFSSQNRTINTLCNPAQNDTFYLKKETVIPIVYQESSQSQPWHVAVTLIKRAFSTFCLFLRPRCFPKEAFPCAFPWVSAVGGAEQVATRRCEESHGDLSLSLVLAFKLHVPLLYNLSPLGMKCMWFYFLRYSRTEELSSQKAKGKCYAVPIKITQRIFTSAYKTLRFQNQ